MCAETVREPWYAINAIGSIDSPALIVYLDRVKNNIALLKNGIDDPQRLRPHVKTHKAPEAALLLLHEGFKKFKCATITEAEMLGMAKAPDVLLAYQPVGPKAARFISLIPTYPGTSFSCLIDNGDAAQFLSEAAAQADVSVRVFIDLNVGMNRTGIAPDERAVQLYVLCTQLPGIVPVGLHAYDGHITDLDVELRKKKCDAAFAPVGALSEALINQGFAKPVIVAGGSATLSIHAMREKVECSPGTFIYWDAGYLHLLPEQPFQPAALVITRVVSLPEKNKICTDLGHKAIASENVLTKRVVFINAPELKFISQSEEHLVLEAAENHSYKIGDVLYGIPFHVCPTCALYERAIVVKKGTVTTEWKIAARDRKLVT